MTAATSPASRNAEFMAVLTEGGTPLHDDQPTLHPVGTTVRYTGSLCEFRGLYGWVAAHYIPNPAALALAAMEGADPTPLVGYEVRLSRKPSEGGAITLTNVRHASLVAEANNG
jgi:hypothetical protein